ncbi:NifB/NifX family molybdenum-iron cluster-binding protein [Candidatus Hodarchaeum mangrovi]
MKIGLPSNGADLLQPFSHIFGRCSYFIIYDIKEQKVDQVLPNAAQNAAGGAGIQAAQLMIDNHVKTVIAPQIGPKAWNVLNNAGIKVYTGIGGSIQQNIDAFLDEQLTEINSVQDFNSGLERGIGHRINQGQGKRQRNF